jgi:hypothetical protein
MKISAGQASQLVRDSFIGLRGTGKSWEMLLSLGGIYLLGDGLGKNLKKAEETIGPKSKEAMMTLYGTGLGIVGSSVELTGFLMPRKATTKIEHSMGRAVVRYGATLNAASGIFDAIQAYIASRHAEETGDTTARDYYHAAAGVVASTGTVLAVLAVFNAFTAGALGVSIIITFLAYRLMKKAEQLESTALERWARRCYFGIANETPRIHWDSPIYADIALSELNAATLGVNGEIKFETFFVDQPINTKIGIPIDLKTYRILKFKLALPRFIESTSSYRWTLLVHRHGDGVYPDLIAGETIISKEHFPPAPLNKKPTQAPIKSAKSPGNIDYRIDSLVVNETRQESNPKHEDHSMKIFSGQLELTPDTAQHNITSASLTLRYWPDRNIPEAYAEFEVKEINL